MTAGHGSDCRECHELVGRLSEYIDGELDMEVCAGIEEHLQDCPPCHAFLESLRRTVALTRDLPGHELPEDLALEIIEAYRKLNEFRA